MNLLNQFTRFPSASVHLVRGLSRTFFINIRIKSSPGSSHISAASSVHYECQPITLMQHQRPELGRFKAKGQVLSNAKPWSNNATRRLHCPGHLLSSLIFFFFRGGGP